MGVPAPDAEAISMLMVDTPAKMGEENQPSINPIASPDLRSYDDHWIPRKPMAGRVGFRCYLRIYIFPAKV